MITFNVHDKYAQHAQINTVKSSRTKMYINKKMYTFTFTTISLKYAQHAQINTVKSSRTKMYIHKKLYTLTFTTISFHKIVKSS